MAPVFRPMMGAAQVEAGTRTEIRAGDRLAASAGGGARELDGAHPAPVGSPPAAAMEPAEAARDDGLIWALVMPR
jgi:hypothetical protein